MKKLLAALGVTSISLSSVSVVACTGVINNFTNDKSLNKFLDLSKFVSQSFILSDAENISIDDSLKYYGDQTINTAWPDSGINNNNSKINSLFASSFGEKVPNSGIFKNLDSSLVNLNGNRSWVDDSFSQISSLISTLVLAVKNGFDVKEATLIEAVLQSEVIKGALSPELLETISDVLSEDNITKLGSIFDFSDLESSTNQEALNYAMNSLILGLADLTGDDKSISSKNDDKLTLFTEFPDMNFRSEGDGSHVLSRIIEKLLAGEASINTDIDSILNAISQIGKALMIIVKYVSDFSNYDKNTDKPITSKNNLFDNQLSDLEVIQKVRQDKFNAKGSLNITYLLKIFDQALNDQSSDLNGFGLQKILAIFFKVDNRERFEFVLLAPKESLNHGLLQLLGGIGFGLGKMEGFPAILGTVLPGLLAMIVLATTNSGEFGFNSGTLNQIKLFAPDIYNVITEPEIINKMNNIFPEIFKGSIIKDLITMIVPDLDPTLIEGLANLRKIFKTPIGDFLKLLNINLPQILDSLVNVSLGDAIKAFKDNYSNDTDLLFKFDNILDIFKKLGEKYQVFNSIGEPQFDGAPQTAINIILHLIVNKGWYAEKNGNRLDLTGILGLNSDKTQILPNTLFESLKNLFSYDDNSEDNSGLFIRKTFIGIGSLMGYMKKQMTNKYHSEFVPYLNSKNFKTENIKTEMIDNNEFISYTMIYRSHLTNQLIHYNFEYKIFTKISDENTETRYWEMTKMTSKKH
ncbi:hypothetical protein SSABA_v1c04690 [Spiroplasma sabaudiense Ar-1343]|uniref:MOLPALP family lipoprotein n=1 Tax=Spiroplasma sabaudiense Ar-1343 TaxID=1276257 RepID=W6AA44_9MOLU|nr:MOLPALP family lipoprotein [Spiroplasma sabaudiense]AHI53876.1 hypothetical protein SSABA_v1c04690 [Spiroplasma sabaudiense Ar-1343]